MVKDLDQSDYERSGEAAAAANPGIEADLDTPAGVLRFFERRLVDWLESQPDVIVKRVVDGETVREINAQLAGIGTVAIQLTIL